MTSSIILDASSDLTFTATASEQGSLAARPATVPRSSVDLEVVIPAYNEEGRLAETVAAAVAYLAQQPYRSAVVVVDNGSVDRTADLAAAVQMDAVPVYLLGCSRQGKGAAIRRGVLSSNARYVGFVDADLATPMETLDRVLPLLEAGAPVVIGSRRCEGAELELSQPLTRRLGGRVFRTLARPLVPGVADTQCGFKFFSGSTARQLFGASSIDGFAFDVELLALAVRFGLAVSEVPVVWTDRAGSTFRPFKHGPPAVADMLRVPSRVRQVMRAQRSSRLPGGSDLASLAGKRVLLVNWRDHEHPQAGGAEVYAREVARRFADAGADVTLFTSRPGGAAGASSDGRVRIVRRGGTLTLYPRAAAYLLRNRRRFAAVVDCQNGIPFFVPLFVSSKTGVVCVIHHVHQDQFGVHFGWPISAVGRLLEGRVSRRVYGGRSIVAVSPSTRAAVRRRLGLRGPIFVVPNGADAPTAPPVGRRASTPTVVVVGRLVAHKRLDLLLGAVAACRSQWPELRVDLAGDGPDRSRLEEVADELGLGEVVRFHGYVDEGRKAALYASGWLTVNPSMAEGWGLGVIEANRHGMPALAFRVPGLTDSVRDGVTGWLVDRDGDLARALDSALRALADPAEAARWSARCRRWAARFSWNDSARRLAGVVVAELARRGADARYRVNPIRSDVSCIAEFPVSSEQEFTALARARLRPTDLWVVRGGRVRLLLHGADENDAVGVLRRLGISGPADLRVATSYDLLVGPGWDDADQPAVVDLTAVPGRAAAAAPLGAARRTEA